MVGPATLRAELDKSYGSKVTRSQDWLMLSTDVLGVLS